MFITAISSKTGYTPKLGDGLNSVGDLSPASFKVEFDEPLKIQNADIELVSCKVSKENKIVISDSNNSLCLRMGEEVEAEQYKTFVKPGLYTASELGNAIADALNRVQPLNIHRPNAVPGLEGGFSSSLSGNKIKITKEITPNPGAEDFQDYICPDGASLTGGEHIISTGFAYNDVEPDGTGLVSSYVKFTGTLPAGSDQIIDPFAIPSSNFITCGGFDLGSQHVDKVSRQAVENWGVWEQGRFDGRRSGSYEAILRPVPCVLETSLSIGYGGEAGAQPATDRPCYWTFEVDPNEDEYGNDITGIYENGSLFTPATQNKSRLRHHVGREYKSINGVLNYSKAFSDQRGAPYNKRKQLIFPYSEQAQYTNVGGVPTFNQKARKTLWNANWTGQMVLSGEAGPPTAGAPPRIPNKYSFQLDNKDIPAPPTATGEGVHYARSMVQQDINVEPENVRVRLTQSPLIMGLPRQTAVDSEVEYSIITATNILLPPVVVVGTPQNIRYKLNSIGQFNSDFGNTIIGLNGQGLNVYGGNTGSQVLPFYKIIQLTAGGLPSEVILVDSGEYIIETVETSNLTKYNTSLFLNDPNTWEYIDPTLANEDVDITDQIYRLVVRPEDIGALADTAESVLDYNTANRYASFNMGLMRDDIFQSVKNEFDPDEALQDRGLNPFALQKNLEIDLYSLLQDNTGHDQPIAGQIKISIHQLQPEEEFDDYYTINGQGAEDNKKLLFNAATNDLAAWRGDPGNPALTNWATFPGVADPDTAIKLSIEMLDTYTIRVSLSNCTTYVDTTSVFAEDNMLCQTGIQRGHVGQPGIHKMECFDKMRFFPLHPVMSALPTSIIQTAPNIVRLKCVGSEYPDRLFENPWRLITGQKACNYEVNINNQVGNDPYRTPQNVAAPSDVAGTTNPPGTKCMMMIKSQRLGLSAITVIPPAAGDTGSVLEPDFSPNTGGSLYQANLPSVMFAQLGPAAPDVLVDFPLGDNDPDFQPNLPSFVVEIQNLPLSGFLGKGFNDGTLSGLKGMGSRLPIVGVVPAREFRELQTDPIVNYYYQTSYYQPTQVRLPTEQSLYSLDINLRDIVSGELLRDLLHSSEVILRIYDLGPNPEMRQR